jgi:hypothetical protein
MKTTSRTYLIIITSIVFGLISTASFAGSLDGKTFSGKAGMLGENAEENDVIKFSNGQFSSKGCQEYGFSSAAYQEKSQGDKIHFVSDTYSEKYGRIIWTGTVDGNQVDATYIWFDKGAYERPEQIKWFSGTLK